MDQQSRQQVLKAYCSNVYTVKIGIGAVILFTAIWNFPKCFEYKFVTHPTLNHTMFINTGYSLSEWFILLSSDTGRWKTFGMPVVIIKSSQVKRTHGGQGKPQFFNLDSKKNLNNNITLIQLRLFLSNFLPFYF